MIPPGGSGSPERVRRFAAATWSFRWQVEREAEVRFDRLAERLEALGARSAAQMARKASGDERRHAEHCARLAEDYGGAIAGAAPAEAPEIAPARLSFRERVLYEVVAACCVAETESTGVLTTLLEAAPAGRMRQVLRELAEDEVRHGRLGWAHLASEHACGATSFLGPLVPAMLEGNAAPDLFQAVSKEREDEALLEHGVLPQGLKRRVFAHTLEAVVFPGLERFGVDTAPARAWLEARRAGLDPAGGRASALALGVEPGAPSR